jgi:ribonuclease HI
MESGCHEKFFEEQNIEGRSDTAMILLAVIEGLEKLKKPCCVTVYSNALFGISNIYKKRKLRDEVSPNAVNSELKARILKLLHKNGHTLKNLDDNTAKVRLAEYIGRKSI